MDKPPCGVRAPLGTETPRGPLHPAGFKPPCGVRAPLGTETPRGPLHPAGVKPPCGVRAPLGTETPRGPLHPAGFKPPCGVRAPLGTETPRGSLHPAGVKPPCGVRAPFRTEAPRGPMHPAGVNKDPAWSRSYVRTGVSSWSRCSLWRHLHSVGGIDSLTLDMSGRRFVSFACYIPVSPKIQPYERHTPSGSRGFYLGGTCAADTVQ
jgi:hypothetical protein